MGAHEVSRPRRRALPPWAVACVVAGLLGATAGRGAAEVRAAYFYDHMDSDHLDSLAAAGFSRAIIRVVADSLDDAHAGLLPDWMDRARALGIELVVDWAFQAPSRLERVGARGRFTWGLGNLEPSVACPLDSLYWRSALLDRADEILHEVPTLKRLAVDFEIYSGGITHYDAGACRCARCLAEYTQAASGAAAPGEAWRMSGLLSYEESRLTRLLSSLMAEFAVRHPGVELSVFDLDYDSFVHRALARALAQNHVPTTDYCERSYSTGGTPLWSARGRLTALGLPNVPLVGGLWLKRFAPKDVPAAVRSVTALADGYFIFSTYSLTRPPAELRGPYVLLGRPADYWQAFAEVNHLP